MLAETAALYLTLAPIDSSATITRSEPDADPGEFKTRLHDDFQRNRRARLWWRGSALVALDPWLSRDGIGYRRLDRRRSDVPNPIPWAEIDTVWTPHTDAGRLAAVGFVAGAAMGFRSYSEMGGPEGGFSIGDAAMFSGLGGLLGAMAGGLIGSASFSWELAHPVEPGEHRRPRQSVF